MSNVGDRLTSALPSEQSRLGYLFWLSRPRFWIYLAGPVIVGVVYGASTRGQIVTPLTIALFLYFLLPANVFLYGINDLFDANIDQANPKKGSEGREVTYRGDPVVTISIIVSALLGLAFVPLLSGPGVVALLGFYLLGTIYSAPPLRLKTTPFLDSISNGLYILPGVVAFAAVAGELPPYLAIAGGWLWTMGMHTFSAIPDIEPDRRANIQTTATLLGEPRTLVYCGSCWLAATIVMGSIHWILAVVFALYPLFVGWIALCDIDSDRAYWWFPAVNTLAGTALTLAGLWRMLYA